MAIVKVGIANDPHITDGTGMYSALNGLLTECESGQIGCNLIWVLGDLIAGIEVTPNFGKESSRARYRRILHDCLKKHNNSYQYQATPGNHDRDKDIFELYFGPTCSSVEISGLRFIVIDTVPKRNARRGGWPSGTFPWDEFTHGEVYGHADRWVINWLKAELESDPDIPTFIGAHFCPYDFTISGGGKTERHVKDSTAHSEAGDDEVCGQKSTRLKYNPLSNGGEIADLIEDATYNVVLFVAAHMSHLSHAEFPSFWNDTYNGVKYVAVRHHSNWSSEHFPWLYLDTTTPANSKVKERYRIDHSDTDICSLDW